MLAIGATSSTLTALKSLGSPNSTTTQSADNETDPLGVFKRTVTSASSSLPPAPNGYSQISSTTMNALFMQSQSSAESSLSGSNRGFSPTLNVGPTSNAPNTAGRYNTYVFMTPPSPNQAVDVGGAGALDNTPSTQSDANAGISTATDDPVAIANSAVGIYNTYAFMTPPSPDQAINIGKAGALDTALSTQSSANITIPTATDDPVSIANPAVGPYNAFVFMTQPPSTVGSNSDSSESQAAALMQGLPGTSATTVASASTAAALSYNFIEQMIQRDVQAIAFSATNPSLSLSV